jgi:DNA end-binding protein Ku
MAARAMWKADLGLGEVKIPVKLYAAVTDTKIHFRLLHAADHGPVVQKMVDAETGEPIEGAGIRKGLEIDSHVYVLLDDEELQALEPKSSRDITVEQVVKAANVAERWFDRPYYLGPDGDDAAYFALAAALDARGDMLIARWVMRKKRYVGAVHGSNGYLMLETLRSAESLVQIDALRPPAHRQPDERELALAEQLVEALADDFDAAAYQDEHGAAVMDLLKTKARGKVVRFPTKRTSRKGGDSLLADLEASLKGRRKNGGR